MLVFGLALAAAAAHWGFRTYGEWAEFSDALNGVESPSTEEMKEAAGRSQFFLGFVLGFILGKIWIAALGAAGFGLGTLTGSGRSMQLLLQCWDRQQASR